ncbi:HAD family phosphatase [Aquipseudomonas guryensis]|uniref:HAD family phosphatase n=1 Tax=Aquipseudomonas guryensis TaxID=2759165 RepID=A0A7W4H4Y3_9GAMM|nr:HAD family phosphatase [Pseudomonas guryensis]MBB1521020.1 HAD family phosphatase [Pseudomonas guryensis]
MSSPNAAPTFNALLFGLSGCLVDFGARTLPVALAHTTGPLDDAALLASATEHAECLPGVRELLAQVQRQQLPAAWLDELPPAVSARLAAALPAWIEAGQRGAGRPWPAPDSIWQALAGLQVENLHGCVLIASEPRLLQAGLNAGLWCIGLATCGSLCGLALGDWQALPSTEREKLRVEATLQLYRLGAHSVIDHPSEVPACLEDLAMRRHKGEKP